MAERRTKRTKDEMIDILESNIGSYVKSKVVDSGRLDAFVADIKAGRTDPYTVTQDIMKNMLK